MSRLGEARDFLVNVFSDIESDSITRVNTVHFRENSTLEREIDGYLAELQWLSH